MNAYKVFETVNARGVRLSATDLLKNYFFSVIHRSSRADEELRAVDDRWEHILGRLAGEALVDFLRVHWISRRGFVRQAELFKTIRGQIKEKAEVFTLLAEMDEDIDPYLALVSPEGSDWSAETKQSAQLLKKFSVRQPFALLLAAKRRLQPKEFEALLYATVIISFRYNVIGNLQTSEQERTYHAEAQRISHGEHATLKSILEGLRSIYPTDDSFKAAFAEKSISATQGRNRAIIRYILSELERQATGANISLESDDVTVEHICPLRPLDGEWTAFTDRDVEELTSRLGNMTLLTRADNKLSGNAEFSVKREIYGRSQFGITRDIARFDSGWTPERVASRQRALAKTATSLWRISQLA